jgi:hypothetical protein
MTTKEFLMKSGSIPKVKARADAHIDTFGKPEPITADKAVYDDIPQYTGKAKFESGLKNRSRTGI